MVVRSRITALRIFSDGASSPDGRGGWGWVKEDDFDVCCSGYDFPTTNQRMEMTAAFEAVKAFPSVPLVIVSDSKYVVDCFNARWWANWERNGWRNSKKQDVANQDIWKPFLEAYKAHPGVIFMWVKGHAGNPANEKADQLAGEAKGLARSLM